MLPNTSAEFREVKSRTLFVFESRVTCRQLRAVNSRRCAKNPGGLVVLRAFPFVKASNAPSSARTGEETFPVRDSEKLPPPLPDKLFSNGETDAAVSASFLANEFSRAARKTDPSIVTKKVSVGRDVYYVNSQRVLRGQR